MNTATTWYINEKIQKYKNSCNSAVLKINNAKTLREVSDFSVVHADPIIGSIKHTIPERRKLLHACDSKVDSLVKSQLKTLQNTLNEKGFDEWKADVSKIRHNEWNFLRGNYPSVIRKIDQEIAMMEHRFSQNDNCNI